MDAGPAVARLVPVTLASGLLRLPTTPTSTASDPVAKTIGIVEALLQALDLDL
jgi:hypothetical protein